MTINLNSSRSSSFTAAILTIVTATLLSVVTGCGAAPKMLPNPVRSSTPTTPTTPTTPATPAAPVFEPHLSAVAFNATTNKLYVADSFLNTITVFDGPTNKILSTITVGDFPVSVAVNPVTNIVYVINFDDQSMSVINGATNTVTATLTSLGINPAAVAVNPVTNKVYITNDAGETYDNVRVLDGVSNTVITSMSVGGLGAIDLAINTKTNTIYVTTGISLAVINGTSDTVQTTLGTVQQSYSDDPAFFGAFGVGVDETSNMVYVVVGSNLTVVSGDSISVVASINLGATLTGSGSSSVVVNPLTHVVYVGMAASSSYSVVNGTTNTLIALKPVTDSPDSPEGLAINPASNTLYLAEEFQIGVINTTTYTTTCITAP